MSTVLQVAAFLFAGFIALNIALTFVARSRAAKLSGQPLPALPGQLGERIGRANRALVYFFTPSCAACRPVTPRMKALAEQGQPVFPIDASQDLALARALSVMATPTTIEVEGGKVVGVHIGPVKPEVFARFGAPA